MTSNGTGGWGPALISLTDGVTLVGRDTTAGVCLKHPAVSRRHAELRSTGGRLVVRDLGSRFGTRVNGEPVREQALQDGDRIGFATVLYQLRGGQLRLQVPAEGLRLEARGLAVVRGGSRLLDNVQFMVAAGQFVGLLGPSGAGKSTLLKCLAGYLPPAAGRLRCDDLELPGDLESYRPHVGYVPQEDLLYPALTGRENLEFALRLRNSDLEAGERAGLIADTLERLHLAEHAGRPVASLSGGERKRFNVAVELLSRPRILFLDEPTSGLDPAGETRLMRLLRDLARRGVTVVCATHVMDNLGLFDQVVVVAGRTVLYSGSPEQVRAHFGVQSYPELYERLEKSPVSVRGSEASTPSHSGTTVSKVLAGIELVPVTQPRSEAPAPRIRLAQQIWVQCLRGLRLLLRDRPLLGLLIGQPVLIGLLINLSQLRPNGMAPIFLFAVVTSIWLGLNSTAREVVRDRRVYVRERLLGATPEGYLGGKLLLFGTVGVAQVALLVAVVRYANLLAPDDARELAAWSAGYLALVFWVAYVSGLLLGLVVSTLAGTQEAAVAALPLILLAQLLLTGVATGLESGSDRSGAFRSLVVLARRAGEELGAGSWSRPPCRPTPGRPWPCSRRCRRVRTCRPRAWWGSWTGCTPCSS
jgi:ABC-type multidrug transport system ATPase subunit